MNNLIGEPQCVPGAQCGVRAANLEFYSGRGISFVKQGRSTTNRNYSQPYVHDVRRPDVHAIRAYRQPAEFHFCELFCHFLSSAIVSDGPHCIPEDNELFRSTFHSLCFSFLLYLSIFLSHSLYLARFSFLLLGFPGSGRCIRRFIQRGTTN